MGEIRNMIVGLLVFSAIVLGMYFYFADFSTNVPNARPVENFTYLDSIQKISEITKNLEQSLKSSPLTGTILDVPLVAASAVYNVLKLIMESFVTVFQIVIDAFVNYLHLPDWVRGSLLAIISALIIMYIVSAVLRWEI